MWRVDAAEFNELIPSATVRELARAKNQQRYFRFVRQGMQRLHQERATLVMVGKIGAGKTNHETLVINCQGLSGGGFVDRVECLDIQS